MANLKNICPDCNRPKGVYAKHCSKCWVTHRSNILSQLPEILEMLKTRNFTMSEIAEKYGVTRQVIQYHYKRSVRAGGNKSYIKMCEVCKKRHSIVRNVFVYFTPDNKEICSNCYILKLKKEGVI